MSVYLIIEVTLIDPEVYGEYAAQVPAVMEYYGGRYLVRGGEIFPVSGGWEPQRMVVIEFDSLEQVQDCLASPEYLSLAPLRKKSATSRVIIVEAYDS
jgi:uncharacterized protein (DUF1330 family)